MFREHSRAIVTSLGVSMVLLGLVSLTSLEAFQMAEPRLTETILTSTIGADPSRLSTGQVNCGKTNATAENGATPPPTTSYVDSNQCNETVVVDPTANPQTFRYKNLGSFCIQCPVIGQSITVGGASGAGGYVKVNSQACQYPPSRGTKGTCDDQGHCTNTIAYDCNTAMDFYQVQSGRGG